MIRDDLRNLLKDTHFNNENVMNEKIENGQEINDSFHRSNSRKIFSGTRFFIEQCQLFLRHEQIEREKKIYLQKKCSAPSIIEFVFHVNKFISKKEK